MLADHYVRIIFVVNCTVKYCCWCGLCLAVYRTAGWCPALLPLKKGDPSRHQTRESSGQHQGK